MMEKEWVTVTPGSAEIEAGGSQKFTVKASVPNDASIGHYGAQIAFTDEVIPSQFRNEAIGIVLGNKEVAASVASAGAPTVRRILPGTSEKFYVPKTLLKQKAIMG